MSKDYRVLFICKSRVDSYGISFGLLNSARMQSQSLKAVGIDAEVMAVFDANCIDKVVTEYNPTHVILHALWVTPLKIEELCKKHPKVSWNIRLHSKPSFLAMEGIASEWINSYVKLQGGLRNLWLSANSIETHKMLKNVFRARSLMLPNAYIAPVKSEVVEGVAINKNRLNIACFGAIRPLKNHYSQALAAIMYADSMKIGLDFHVNNGREEQGGDRVFRNLVNLFKGSIYGHRLIEHHWYSHGVLVHEVLPKMDLGMQVSFTETFNIVAADMVSAGIPTIGSEDIYWMNWLFKADPNDLRDMVNKIGLGLCLGGAGVWLNKRGLKISNRWAVGIWKDGLEISSLSHHLE